MQRGVTISYAGVHTAYQLALAAQEFGGLQAFYCSLYDDPSAWGGRLARLVGSGQIDGRRADPLALDHVVEFPWPVVVKSLRDRIYPRGVNHWLAVNAAFDAWAAAKIRRAPPRLFIGTATSALFSLAAARRVGAVTALDCPSLHPDYEARLLDEAGDAAGIAAAPRRRRWRRRRDMADRKRDEYARADRLLTYSPFHAASFTAAGIDAARLFVVPLWADPQFWSPGAAASAVPTPSSQPLRLLFVGSVSLRKGIPFLVRAMDLVGGAAALTIVGPGDAGSAALLGRARANVAWLPAQSKEQLRATYRAHDVFVLPSIAEAFGYVALEAMASGLPVIATERCGAPLPEPGWSVPALDPAALATRIMIYADDRVLVAADGARARAFAIDYTPARYRQTLGTMMRSLL